MGNTCDNPADDRRYERVIRGNRPTEEFLHILTPVFLPLSSQIRIDLYRRFAQHISRFPNVKLWTIECALVGQPFQVTQQGNPSHVQVRCRSRMWIKENLINILLRKLPSEAKFIAWVDADIHFHNPNWVEETIQRLQRVDLVQLFEVADFIGRTGQVQYRTRSLMYYATREINRLPEYSKSSETYPHPGYAWAMNRSYLDQIGKLYEGNIVGSGDKFMAYAALGRYQEGMQAGCKITDGFIADCKIWASRAVPRRGYSYVSGKISHQYHGERDNRGYVSRWTLLDKHKFDPRTDLAYNSDSVLELLPHKQELQADLDIYFSSRKDQPPLNQQYALANPQPPVLRRNVIVRQSNGVQLQPIQHTVVYSTSPHIYDTGYPNLQSSPQYYETGYVAGYDTGHPQPSYGIAGLCDNGDAGGRVSESVVYDTNNDNGYEVVEYEQANDANTGWY